jgi:hypothetical protein
LQHAPPTPLSLRLCCGARSQARQTRRRPPCGSRNRSLGPSSGPSSGLLRAATTMTMIWMRRKSTEWLRFLRRAHFYGAGLDSAATCCSRIMLRDSSSGVETGSRQRRGSVEAVKQRERLSACSAGLRASRGFLRRYSGNVRPSLARPAFACVSVAGVLPAGGAGTWPMCHTGWFSFRLPMKRPQRNKRHAHVRPLVCW